MLQVNVKRRLVYGAILFMWTIIPVYVTAVGSAGTGIVHGTCVPWGVYSSYAMEVAVMSSVFLTTYLLPLMLMTFCYIRIVYALRYKVSYGGFLYSSGRGEHDARSDDREWG